ncbi:MAG: mannose-1-phosphate guanylyltransferase [Sphingomonas sp.]|nr:mannose-1-phosphate guanylyltransferase [Sphingomonas sp.]
MLNVIQPVILAGGSGTRLWPLSTPSRPKHLLSLVGQATLLEQTLDRVGDGRHFAAPLIVCNSIQADDIRNVASGARLIIEPVARNSAAAICLAALQTGPHALLLVMPSDHFIRDSAALLSAVKSGAPFAQAGRIITLGVVPTRPETGFGYIKVGQELGPGVHSVDRFIEKPSAAVADQFLASGQYLWNAGIFLMKAETLLSEMASFAPQILQCAKAAMEQARVDGSDIFPTEQALTDCPSLSIDYAVMEKSSLMTVVPTKMEWTDIGSWGAIHEIAEKDENGNSADESCKTIDSRDCLIRTSGPRVCAIGLDNIIIVATADEILVTTKADAQRVREAADWAAQAGK